MRRVTSLLIGLATIALFASSHAHAQVIPLSQWNSNYASNTITPRPSTLQVPCANIVGGCNGSSSLPQALGTTSTPTFAGVIVNGNVTSTSFTSTSTTNSSIQILNTEYHVPANYASGGCFGSSTTTDLGACANLALAEAAAAGVSSTNLYLPAIPGLISYATTINLGNNNQYMNIIFPPGTGLLYTGTSTGVIFNEGTGFFGTSHVVHGGGSGGLVFCSNSSASNATTTGAIIGGANGEAGLDLSMWTFDNCGTGFIIATNTYMLSLYAPSTFGNVQNWHIEPAVNSGESIKMFGGTFGDCGNSSATFCEYVDNSAVSQLTLYSPDMDDTQLYIGSGNPSVVIYSPYFENPRHSIYGSYIPIYATSTTNGSLTIYSPTFMNDATSSATGAYPSLIKSGYPVTTVYSPNIVLNGNATSVPLLFDTSLMTRNGTIASGTTSECNAFNGASNNGVVSFFPSSTPAGPTPLNGCWTAYGLGAPVGNEVLNNTYEFGGHVGNATTTPTDNTGGVVGSDNAGIITIATATISSTLTFATPWNFTPACVGSAGLGSNATTSNIMRELKITTTTLSFVDATNFATNSQLTYVCFGNPN